MAQISRKYTFQPKKKIQSAQVNEELDQLVQSHNDLDTNKANKTAVLQKGDTTPYTPTAGMDPANKQYVDQAITAASLGVSPTGGVTPGMLSFNAADAGTTNASQDEIFSLFLPVDTRSWTTTTWDSNGNPTTIQIKDGAVVVCTLTAQYDADSHMTQLVASYGTHTITWTVTWTGGQFQGFTKAVS